MSFRIQCDDCGEWFDSDSIDSSFLHSYGTCAKCSGVRTDESDDDDLDESDDDDLDETEDDGD